MTPTPSTPTNTNKADAVLGAAKPMGNTYEQSSITSSDAIKEQTMARGHNVFRPDVYRVSEGTVI